MRYIVVLAAALSFIYQSANAAEGGTGCPRGYVSKISPEDLASCIAAAEQGDVNAQMIMGDLYALAWGGQTKDRIKAMEWYQRAAKAGHAEGQFKLGTELGRGSPQEMESGKEWVIKAAMQGYDRALGHLRQLMFSRSQQDPSFDEYLEIIKKAALVDMPDKRVLAVTRAEVCQAFREGAGTAIDYKSAAFWCAKAAESGSAVAEWELIKIHKLGLGVIQDHKKAEEMWQSFFTRQVAVTSERNQLQWFHNAARVGFCSAAETIKDSYETGKYEAERSAEKSKAWGKFAERCKARETGE